MEGELGFFNLVVQKVGTLGVVFLQSCLMKSQSVRSHHRVNCTDGSGIWGPILTARLEFELLSSPLV